MRFTERRGLLRDQRGSVYAEGVIVAFFFVIMFGAILWVHRTYAAEHAVTVDVRQGTWTNAVAGCEDGTAARELEGASSFRPSATDIAPEIESALEEVLHQTVVDSATQTAHVPKIVGGGSRSVRDRAETHCNTRPRHEPFPIRDEAIRYFCRVHPGDQISEAHQMQWRPGCDPSVNY